MTSKTTAVRPVALVTGAGRNIGRCIALTLARQGFSVAVNVRTSVQEGQSVVDELKTMGVPALLVPADVTDPTAVRGMLLHIESVFGRLDALVNNAAVRREFAFEDMGLADWQSTLAVVLDGAFLCTQAAMALLKQSSRGAVVNIGGMTAHTGAAQRVHVVTAKAGLVGLTRALAHDMAPLGITVNCVSPGLIDTVRVAKSSSASPHHHQTHQTLLGRRGQPQEVADMVAWLAGEQARFVTGQVMHVNGGAYLGG